MEITLYFFGDFQTSRQYAVRAVELWRSGEVRSPVEGVDVPAFGCLCFKALCDWHLGEGAACQATVAEATSLAKELNDTHGLAVALWGAAVLAHHEHNPGQVERWASELIEVSTRHHFAYWLALGTLFRGWARSASGHPADGLAWSEQGIRDYRATGSIRAVPFYLALKAEALHLANRTPEALETIQEAEALAESFGEGWWRAELQRLRGVFLASLGAEEAHVEATFREAIATAQQQKSMSLLKRAEASRAECRSRRGSR